MKRFYAYYTWIHRHRIFSAGIVNRRYWWDCKQTNNVVIIDLEWNRLSNYPPTKILTFFLLFHLTVIIPAKEKEKHHLQLKRLPANEQLDFALQMHLFGSNYPNAIILRIWHIVSMTNNKNTTFKCNQVMEKTEQHNWTDQMKKKKKKTKTKWKTNVQLVRALFKENVVGCTEWLFHFSKRN